MRGRVAIFRSALLPLLATAAVCQPQLGIPENTAKVILQYGRLSALGGNGEKALSVGDLVGAQEMIVAGPDGYGQFQIADGSTFEVFANARVMFREHPNNSVEDFLDVLLGHVKVFIQRLNGLPNYKQVSSPTAVISVRGTVFDVVVEDDDGTTYITVDEGEVWVKHQTQPGGTVVLKPGDSIRVYRNQPIAVRIIDKGALGMRILKSLEQAVYEMVWHSRVPGGVVSVPVGGTTTAGGASGDTGKGGSAPSAPGAPSAPSAPGPPH